MFDFRDDRGKSGSMLERYGSTMGNLIERRLQETALLAAKQRAERSADETEAANEALRQEMEQRMQALAHLEYVANHDPLTALPNRNLFNNRLSHMLDAARRSGQSLGLMFLDLDHFKSVNDTLGHGVGDELLKGVAERLQACVRAEDTLARLGGDEFAIIQLGLNYPPDAYVQAQRILESLAEPFYLGSHKLYSGTSIGITVFPGDADNPDQLQQNADLAMYQAKEEQRNTFRFFNADLNATVQRRLFLEQELRTALDQKQFVVYYQPKLALKDIRVAGAEALIRWLHPDEGLVSPAEFIPVAERTGTISAIGEWMLRESCRQFQEWRAAGYPPLMLAVNLSAAQFKDRDIPAMVREILDETGLEPGMLELEITETAVMHDMSNAVDVLTELHKLGVSLSIDDFGTGYSSLSYLRQLPVNRITIDRSFIAEVDRYDAAAAIARAVVMLGQSLNLEVVAEGVENEAQLEFLKQLGCDEAQGYLFSTAVPAEEFASYVLSQGVTTHD